MAFSKSSAVILLMTMMSTLCGVSMAAEYKLDHVPASGWTLDMLSPKFGYPIPTGETHVFEFDNKSHSMLVVSREDYLACNTASPIAKDTSGRMEITIQTPGNLYIICGFPNHCQNGDRMMLTGMPMALPNMPNGGVMNSPSIVVSSGQNIAPAAAA